MLQSLMTSRRFAPLFWCQFFSAFSDNFLKNALVFLLLFHLGGPNAEALITLAGAIFIAPYFFLSALGGEMADRFDKARVARYVKFAEIGIAFVAVAGFALQSIPILFVALFLFGVIGALFGPIKYGILPDHLVHAELPAGNALIEGATFIAILLGTIAGGLASKGGGNPVYLSLLMIFFSILCWVSSLYIPPTGQAAPDLPVRANIAASTSALMRHVWSDARLRWGTLITSWFWLVGVIVMALLPPLIKNVLGGSEEVVTAYLAAFSIAVGIGSALAAMLAAGRIVLWPTVLGGIVLGLAALDLGWQTFGVAAGGVAGVSQVFTSSRGLRALLDLVGIAIGGGLFIVPTFAAVQAWAGADHRARVVAAVNVLNAAFMAAGALGVALIQKAGVGPAALFFGLGVANLLVTLLIVATVPGGTRKLFAVADRADQPETGEGFAAAPAAAPVMAMKDEQRTVADEFPLSASSHAILAMPYPKFSNTEMTRRHAAMAELMRESEADHLVFCGVNRFGSSVPWLTQWPVTTEAVGVFSPDERDALFVQHVNHAPLARELAREADVAWGGVSSIASAIEVLEKRRAQTDRVAVIGPLGLDQHAALSARFGALKNLSRRYTALRQIKSAEELDWLRLAATFTDRGMAAFRDALVPGITERALGDRIERSYTADGATNWIHYIGATPMEDPSVPVPRQFPSTRALATGDVAFAEISADFWGYTAQVLRSFSVGCEPNALYRDLHATADAAFDAIASILRDGTTPAEVIEAAVVIENNGFTIIDDLLHGYGGGYLPPVLGSKSRPAGPVPDAPFRAGMTVVIQPNVVTRDGKAGVQTGEMVLITQNGIERLHAFPRGFATV